MNKKIISIMLISFSLLSCVGIKPAYASNSTSSSSSTNNSIGWRHPSPDEWYYCKSNGKLATGLYSPDKEHTYYFNESSDQLGLMYTGWLKIGNDWHYFDEKNSEGSWGSEHRGWLYKSKNETYYFDDTGKMVTGFYSTDQSHTYYLEAEEVGKIGFLRVGWKKVGNDWYYLNQYDTDGPYAITHSGWLTVKNDPSQPKYYFNGEHKMVTGWLEIAPGEKYYFYESGSQIGQMAKGTVKVNGINYKFNDQGMLIK